MTEPRIIEDFVELARRYCSIVESAASIDRENFVEQLYRILPELIGAALELPVVSLNETDSEISTSRVSQEQWTKLFRKLQDKLSDWDLYQKVLDPTTEKGEVATGSLADDIADIYRDLSDGLDDVQAARNEVIFEWRFSFYSHWGRHAIDALDVIHSLISESLM